MKLGGPTRSSAGARAAPAASRVNMLRSLVIVTSGCRGCKAVQRIVRRYLGIKRT